MATKPKLKKTAKSRGGRPSTYTKIKANKICRLIREGYTLSEISRIDGMPKRWTVWNWRQKHPEFAHMLAEAELDQADAFFEEAIEAARNITPKWANAVRVQIDTYKWAAAMRNRRVYGKDIQRDTGVPAAVEQVKEEYEVITSDEDRPSKGTPAPAPSRRDR